MKIALACGGTGGHIFPGLATAHALRARGHEVTLWLAGKAGEAEAVRQWDGPKLTVPAEGFPSRPTPAAVRALWRLWRAARKCGELMDRERPDGLLGMGSYATVGPVLAARQRGVPVTLHEANVIPGRAIRLLYRRADAVAAVFEETRFYLRAREIAVTGLPLRPELARAAAEERAPRAPDAPFTVLVIGGSRGAHRLNEIVSEALPRAAASGLKLRAIHLTGRDDEEMVRARYAENGLDADVRAFRHDMAEAYRQADLALCRAGAATCAELLAFGVPALLVPFPFAIHAHQLANARAMEKMGAADVVEEADLESEWLAQYVAGVARSPARLARMRTAALKHARLDAAEALARVVERTLHARLV